MILRPRDIRPRIAMTANLRFKPSRKGRKKSAEEEVKDSELKVDSEMRAELEDSDEEIDPECLEWQRETSWSRTQTLKKE